MVNVSVFRKNVNELKLNGFELKMEFNERHSIKNTEFDFFILFEFK